MQYENHTTQLALNIANLSDVRDLDLSHNELPAPPSSAWHSMHHLRTLNLAGNPINQVMNDSFLGLDKLEFLDISDVKASLYQVYYLCNLITCGAGASKSKNQSADFDATATDTTTNRDTGQVSAKLRPKEIISKYDFGNSK